MMHHDAGDRVESWKMSPLSHEVHPVSNESLETEDKADLTRKKHARLQMATRTALKMEDVDLQTYSGDEGSGAMEDIQTYPVRDKNKMLERKYRKGALKYFRKLRRSRNKKRMTDLRFRRAAPVFLKELRRMEVSQKRNRTKDALTANICRAIRRQKH